MSTTYGNTSRNAISEMSIFLDYKQAVGLLRADLVWSGDFDAIRLPLADYLERAANANDFDPLIHKLVKAIIADENNITI
jgi:hypothetical protein